MTDVAGGLDEPDGAAARARLRSRLARPEDDWSARRLGEGRGRVLRKARRLGDDDPDDAVWAALARTTYDGIAITAARHARTCSTAWCTSGPSDARRRLGRPHPRRPATTPPPLHDLENGATVAVAGSTADDLAAALDGRPARPGAGRARRRRPLGHCRARLRGRARAPHAAPPTAPDLGRRRIVDDARASVDRRAAWLRARRARPSSSTRRPCTSRVPRTPRSSATAWPPARRACGCSTDAGVELDERGRPDRVPATPRPTSSSPTIAKLRAARRLLGADRSSSATSPDAAHASVSTP